MSYAVSGRILYVDLSTNNISVEKTSIDLIRRFAGGYGYASIIFYDYLKREGVPSPFSGKNPLIVMTGPLTGVSAFGAKACIASRSPLTSGFSWSVFSGSFAVTLKKAGFDGIVVIGESENPVYLVIDNEHTELKSASQLWGLDTFETHSRIQRQHGKDFRSVAIGVAGEKLVKIAAIVTDERRVAARTGLGAVMGSKKLKAIVVRGTGQIRVYDEAELSKLNREWLTKARQTVRGKLLSDYGTSGLISVYEATGGLPIKNWTMYKWEGSSKLTGQYIMKNYAKGPGRKVCGSGILCSIACERVLEFKSEKYGYYLGKGPEYESICALGLMLMIDDTEAVIKLNELCDKLGLDTISTGAVIAWAFEAFEKGILTENDTGGLRLEWGSTEVVFKLVSDIAYRRGLGSILSEGVKNASAIVGKGSESFALHVKGLEVPYHDPRIWKSVGLVYATSNRGACHLQGMTYHVDRGAVKLPEYGITEPPKTPDERARAVIVTQNLCAFLDSAGLCKFGTLGVVDFDLVARVWTAATGITIDKNEILVIGERVWYSTRILNYLLGLSNSDDTLPHRFRFEPVSKGPGAGSVFEDFDASLKFYYAYRRLDSIDGLREKIEELGLVEYLDSMDRIFL